MAKGAAYEVLGRLFTTDVSEIDDPELAAVAG
ncbi:Uncharacterised protein [Mycobacterium tuberculosis]|nr:Uncharacterised protein [Mycobacterium tuberculosis]